ncbi:MAG: biotin--[acetyl-CoA-carboxylase] ligase [Planctomycetota bacterium]
MAWRRFHFDIVDSTNDRAFAAIEAGTARHGDLFIAGSQTAGRGTRGRRWESRPGGLYVSAVVESPDLPAPGAWTIAGALAVHDVAIASGVDAALDWPNDLVGPGGAKIAGVLAESRGLGAGRPALFVVGVGLNVAGVPREIRMQRPVASLRELGGDLGVDAAGDQLAGALEARIGAMTESPTEEYRAFFERSLGAHEPVGVTVGETEVRGTWTDLTPDQGLRIAADDGRIRHVSIAHARDVRRR